MFEHNKSFGIWLFQVLVLLGLLAFFLWLGLRPKNPTYAIVDFSVPSSNSSNSNATSLVDQGTQSQSGAVLFNLEIHNPNQDSGIYHDDISLTFYYGQDTVPVGQKTVPAFYQGKDETRQIVDSIDGNGQVWKTLLASIRNATAEMNVGLVTSIRYRTLGHKSKHHRMNLQGLIKIGSDGKILGMKKKVKLTQASKKWKLRATRS